MNILDEIVAFKYTEVSRNKETHPVKALEQSRYFNRTTASLKSAVLDPKRHGIIAEIKRKSPSKGTINSNVDAGKIAHEYFNAGVSGISVLTDQQYFGGSNSDLIEAREKVACPILRKDFIVDEYQIIEAKAIGADVILLIAAALSELELKSLSQIAHSLSLEVLLEVHNEAELDKSGGASPDLIGVNNRDLQTFQVSLDTSRRLISRISKSYPAVSESGIENPEAIKELKQLGYRGFLIGQSFMQTNDPGLACRNFIQLLT
jgi:indole-3-glycerol phosphate synthase